MPRGKMADMIKAGDVRVSPGANSTPLPLSRGLPCVLTLGMHCTLLSHRLLTLLSGPTLA